MTRITSLDTTLEDEIKNLLDIQRESAGSSVATARKRQRSDGNVLCNEDDDFYEKVKKRTDDRKAKKKKKKKSGKHSVKYSNRRNFEKH